VIDYTLNNNKRKNMSIFNKEVKLENIKDLDKRYEVMRKTVEYAIDKCETEVSNLIEEYNESLPEDNDYSEEVSNYTEVDTVDLHSSFNELRDYIEDYSQ
jgi:hypothetical protein|tara:strand:+ start:805 stop:1104 length:300 start_codon:yes stop_codon:yes gene_type:complete